MELSIFFFLLYIAVVVVIGIVSSRKETEDDFMIAERKVHGIQVAATMSASSFDGATLAIYLAYVYQYGFSAIWLFIGIAIGFIFVRKYAWRIKQRADELKVYSMPEYFFRVLGKKNGLMFSLFIVIQFFLLLTVNFIISGKVLAAIFPIPYYLAVLIGGLIILTYLLLAGFKAVVRTDFFQMVIMFIMTLSVGIFLFGKTEIPVAEFNLGTLGVGNILGFLILAGVGIMATPDLWQRIFATKDEKNLRRGLNYSAVLLLILGVVISIVGLATKQFFPSIAPEDALVTGFSHLLPFGFKEFGMVLLYAVALSSSDTATFVISSIFTRDLKNYFKKYSEESMKKLTRFFMIIFIVLAMLIGIFYQNIMALGFSLAGLGLALFPVIFGSFYWKLKQRAVFWSLVLGFLSVLTLFVTNQLNPQNAVLPLPVVLISLFIFQKLFKAEQH
ncbi:MAG: Na+/solute symporter [Parcubacteria group bacterium GW2011_GWF2_44_8b]|nr:MAG: Na+/solute symporter [Parcubacteria group bacterium GW2011_GWC1_43_30]KKT80870.1 MAG: Na+/solute symporter [Parcubacteria group bacterium GW2011_GWF2_44_8b]KKT86080.1 MAG: Na+/solute symporter [Parcubacteria group bacterium GW2011_GWD1_44_9]